MFSVDEINSQLKDDGTATIEKPPNHKLFDALSATNLAPLSPLQLRRLQAQKENSPAPITPQIHNHISFPDNLFGLLQTRPVAEPVPSAAALNPRPPLVAMLIPNRHEPGLTCTIEDFCARYELDNTILTKLKDNGYSRMHTFKYIEISELQDMGFKPGEIVELKEAVRLWAVQPSLFP
jgi:hypothetical protein